MLKLIATILTHSMLVSLLSIPLFFAATLDVDAALSYAGMVFCLVAFTAPLLIKRLGKR